MSQPIIPTPVALRDIPSHKNTTRLKALKTSGGTVVNCELEKHHADVVRGLAVYYGSNTGVIRALIDFAGKDLLQKAEELVNRSQESI